MLKVRDVNNVKVSKLIFDGNAANVPGDTTQGTTLLAVWNAYDITIEDNYFTTNDYIASYITAGSNRVKYHKNTFVNTDCGIIAMGTASTNLTITNNMFSGGTSEGISMFSSATTTGVIIKGNNISGKGGSGILLKNVSGFTVSGNIVRDNDSGILLNAASDGVIKGNFVYSNTYDGITDGGAITDVVISANVVRDHRSCINLGATTSL